MNADRRGRISKLRDELEGMLSEVEDILEEEEEAQDNIPEGLRNSERYDRSEAAIESLTEARDGIESAVASLDNACE